MEKRLWFGENGTQIPPVSPHCLVELDPEHEFSPDQNGANTFPIRW